VVLVVAMLVPPSWVLATETDILPSSLCGPGVVTRRNGGTSWYRPQSLCGDSPEDWLSQRWQAVDGVRDGP
jgi:hypothetical protein